MFGSDKKEANAVGGMKKEKIIPKMEDNTYSVYSTDKRNLNILFIMEDSGYAFNFMCDYLRRVYFDIPMTIIGSGGGPNVVYALDYYLGIDRFTHAIIMYDSGGNPRDVYGISLGIDKIREMNDISIYEFCPECFEHILCTYNDLVNIISNTSSHYVGYYNTLINNIQNGNKTFILDVKSKTLENYFENMIEDLTTESDYTCIHGGKGKHSFFSECWIRSCNGCDEYKPTCKCMNDKISICKTDYISKNSILSLLADIMDKILHWNREFGSQVHDNYRKRYIKF